MSSALPILTFHALENHSSLISFPPIAFRRGLAHLREKGYGTCRLMDVVARLRHGKPLPTRSVVITFDDGYRSVYQEALPVLREHDMTATIFITTGRPGQSDPDGRLPTLFGRQMLSWSEIREMHAQGIDIGAHTLTHPNLTQLPLERVEAELQGSKAVIEDALDSPVDCFSYPYGLFDQQTRDIARQNFSCACSDRLRLVRGDSDPYTLERVETYYLRRARLFNLIPTPWLNRYLRIRRIPRLARRMMLPMRK